MKRILSLFGLAALLSGCNTVLNCPEGKQVTITSTVLGLEVAATDTTTQSPKVRFGLVRETITLTPTSTNKLYAPPVMTTFANDAATPFSTHQRENVGVGDVILGYGTNGANSAASIIPSATQPLPQLKRPE